MHNEALHELIREHEYTHFQLYEMAYHHLCKREKILGRDFRVFQDYIFDAKDDVALFNIQVKNLEEKEICYVLNTSILVFLEYKPKAFLHENYSTKK